MTGASGASDRTFTAILAVACVVLAVLVVALAVQNLRLKGQVGGDPASEAPSLAPGDVVAPLVLVDGEFRRYTLDWSSTSRTVLYVYTTTCPVCVDMQPVWTAMAERLRVDGGVRVVGIELDRPNSAGADPGTVPALAYPFPTYAIDVEPNEAFLQLVPYVPATIVLDATGKVHDARFGMLDDDAVDAVAAAIEERAR